MSAGVAQLVEQLICNQQVVGSSPSTSSIASPSAMRKTSLYLGEFPSGQRGQTVNLLSTTSVVRIHLPPPEKSTLRRGFFNEVAPCGANEEMKTGLRPNGVVLRTNEDVRFAH